MNWGLPTSVEVRGTMYAVRSDFRVVLDILAAASDPQLDGREKAFAVLAAFYPDFSAMPAELYEDALKACFRFVNGGAEESVKNAPRLVDWEQDFSLVIAPVNRVLGVEARSLGFLHWWSFLSAYFEIGDCTFAQVVRIRNLLARGKSLDPQDREWYRFHRDLVDFKSKYSAADQKIFSEWGC